MVGPDSAVVTRKSRPARVWPIVFHRCPAGSWLSSGSERPSGSWSASIASRKSTPCFRQFPVSFASSQVIRGGMTGILVRGGRWSAQEYAVARLRGATAASLSVVAPAAWNSGSSLASRAGPAPSCIGVGQSGHRPPLPGSPGPTSRRYGGDDALGHRVRHAAAQAGRPGASGRGRRIVRRREPRDPPPRREHLERHPGGRLRADGELSSIVRSHIRTMSRRSRLPRWEPRDAGSSLCQTGVPDERRGVSLGS